MRESHAWQLQPGREYIIKDTLTRRLPPVEAMSGYQLVQCASQAGEQGLELGGAAAGSICCSGPLCTPPAPAKPSSAPGPEPAGQVLPPGLLMGLLASDPAALDQLRTMYGVSWQPSCSMWWGRDAKSQACQAAGGAVCMSSHALLIRCPVTQVIPVLLLREVWRVVLAAGTIISPQLRALSMRRALPPVGPDVVALWARTLPRLLLLLAGLFHRPGAPFILPPLRSQAVLGLSQLMVPGLLETAQRQAAKIGRMLLARAAECAPLLPPQIA